MSDALRHECGLAVLRLRKPLTYYTERYGDPAWGLRRMYLLMEKQRNRGQDGAGLAVVKFDMPEGDPYLVRARSAGRNPIDSVFRDAMRGLGKVRRMIEKDAFTEIKAKRRMEHLGEVYLGHLRYGTHAGHSKSNCHPYVRRNNVPSRNLAIAGNFNMTNSRELFNRLVEFGLHPVGDSDTQVILEKLGHGLDQEHDHLRATMGPGSFRGLEGQELGEAVSRDIDLGRVLQRASRHWDGGYVFGALLGNGDAFVCRDPAGIRPAFFYEDDEVFAMASERAALVTVFDVSPDRIRAVRPGCIVTIKRDGAIEEQPFTEALPERQCTFERIYFSRGNDRDIYRERKALGEQLAPRVLDALGGTLDRAVFSFIPNTAESAYMGLVETLERLTRRRAAEALWEKIQNGGIQRADVEKLLNGHPRLEKAAHKDQKLRTFITRDDGRDDLVSHVYDITPGVVEPGDTLVVLDDSIVRGTTLRDSIVTMLGRLNPARIIIVSSAPPIMYPDCYGIDMSQLGRFIAFEAAVSLARERGEEALLDEIEKRCAAQQDFPVAQIKNHVALLYERFTLDEISANVARLIRSRHLQWAGALDVIYQSVEGLHASMPDHRGDWYFTGRYPTPGGYRVLNTAYLNWRRNDDSRSY